MAAAWWMQKEIPPEAAGSGDQTGQRAPRVWELKASKDQVNQRQAPLRSRHGNAIVIIQEVTR